MFLGFDEVGRGALAGPVVVSLVGTPSNWPLKIFAKSSKSEQEFLVKHGSVLPFVHDSKRLSAGLRESISEYLIANDFVRTTLSGSNVLIDRFGIGRVLSHLLAIGCEVISDQLKQNDPLKVYVDGRIKVGHLDFDLVEQLIIENQLIQQYDPEVFYQRLQTDWSSGFEKFVVVREDKADATYLPVALASNLAKVYRDRLMQSYALEYPEFGWDTNVGYGTKSHREAIQKHPNNPLFRNTWLKKILS
jgi:ribonuclease HII